MFMRRMIRGALESVGYEVCAEAANGAECLEHFERLSPDIITMDVVMPEMDGIETLRRIRKQCPDAKVIMITAIDQRNTMLEALKIGVSDFIVKPFSEDRVISAVERVLSGHSGHDRHSS